jgi:glycosyltransferase A (GT-A) superfamily protein (DUF2064 family)
VLGARWAAELADAFLSDTWTTAATFDGARPVLVVAKTEEVPALQPAPEIWQLDGLRGGALIEATLRRALLHADFALALHTDSPGLPGRLLEQARQAAEAGSDSVIGPSEHGGVYLVGARRCPVGLLSDLAPPVAYDAVAQRFRAAEMNPVLLEPWYDVDAPADLARLRAELVAGAVQADATARALRRSAAR